MAPCAIPDIAKLRVELLPDAIDRRSREDPSSIFCSIPRGTEVSDGFRDVTFREFTNAANRASWFLEKAFGKSTTYDTICYLGPNDLRYSILAIAAAKTGHKAFWSSPRNSHVGHIHLLKTTQCKYFLTPAAIPPGIQAVIDELKIRHVVVPDQEVWMDPEPVPDYPLGRRYEDIMCEPFLVIHTSGTSGLPKPIPLTYGTVSIVDVLDQVPFDERGIKTIYRFMKDNGGRMFCPFPMFHGGGIYLFLICAIYFGNIPVLAPNKTLTPELADEVHRSGAVTASFLPPSVVDGIVKKPEFLENLSHMKFLLVTSAPLPAAIADVVKQKTRIVNFYGQTESGLLQLLLPGPDDPLYIRVGPISGTEFRHYEDDLYEFIMVRNEKYRKSQGAFLWQADITEFSLNDLFSRHPDPTKSDYWLYRGRLDDIIVFENGEKINPVTMESVIETHPKVHSAMVVGAGREQASVLIQPKGPSPETEKEEQAFIEEIWDTIERANEEIPAHGKLVKELVLFTMPNSPILRSLKNSVRRQATYEQYAARFDAAYLGADDAATGDSFPINLDASEDVLHSQLLQLISQTTKIVPSNKNEDFFGLGMDSLQALQLSRRLRSSLRNDAAVVKKILPSLIYNHPSISKLGKAILSSKQGKVGSQSRIHAMETMLERYICQLPPTIKVNETGKYFILTGTTGGLGSYLLGTLIQDPTVRHVYCLNRSVDAAARQQKLHILRGLPSPSDASRITFLQSDYSKADLGVGHDSYLQLIRSTTHIIHNAWTVDWKLSLDSFSSTNLAGVRHLINLASVSRRRAKLTFVSSLSTVNQWTVSGNQSPVPEQIVENPRVVEPMGYAESKYVAELLLDAARERLGIPTCVLRLGQIAGPVHSTKGEWTVNEWLPRLIRSSSFLGLLPSTLGLQNRVDWIPVDILAGSILEFVNACCAEGSTPVYNVINPSVTHWNELYPVVENCLMEYGTKVKVVGLGEWVQALRKTVATTKTTEDIVKNPAVQLIDFYQELSQPVDSSKIPEFSTTKGQKVSKTFRACGAITPSWMRLYMKQWGYLPTEAVQEYDN